MIGFVSVFHIRPNIGPSGFADVTTWMVLIATIPMITYDNLYRFGRRYARRNLAALQGGGGVNSPVQVDKTIYYCTCID